MPFKRIKKTKGIPKSTLDIVEAQDVIASEINAKCSTGDILMYANDMKEAKKFHQIIQATSGTTTMERRMPIIHIACLVRDPPKHVLDHYGLEPDPDGFNSYIFEGVPPQTVMMHIKPWIKKQYDPDFPGGQVFWRKKLAPIQATAPDELWEFIIEAKKLPYANKWYMAEVWQGLFFMWVLEPSSFFMLLNTITKVIRVTLQESLGPGLARTAGAYLASWVGYMVALNCFITAGIVFGIPVMIGVVSTKLADALGMTTTPPYTKGYGLNKDGSLKFMICSVVTGAAIQKLGIYDEENGPHPSMFLPKDYLPQGIGGGANLFDMALKRGVKYSDTLVRVANPFGAPPKRTFSPSMIVAGGVARKALRNTLAMTRDSMAFDVNEFQRNLATGNKKVQNSVLGKSRIVTQNVFESNPIIEEDEEEDEDDEPIENKKDD